MLFEDGIKLIKDYLFPVYCLECDKEGDWVCKDCKVKLTPKGVFCCPICHTQTELGVTCAVCWPRSFLSAQISLDHYKEGKLLAKAIECFKYQYAEELINVFGRMTEKFSKDYPDIFQIAECIVPVPLHARRFAERGFNQAELIAQILSKHIIKPVKNILQRTRYTKQQTHLPREKRIENVKGAFEFSKNNLFKTVILVDDVFTTGSTMQECARVLKENEVEKVIGFTVARG